MSIKVPFGKPFFSSEARAKITLGIDEILSSGNLMFGKYTKNFETSFAKYIGTEFALSVNSCTTALQICMMHFDIKGKEILVPAGAFLTDISAVRWAGGIPVLVDIDPATLSFDIADLKNKITANTTGIIWVHLTGVIASNWKEILTISKENNLFLIEDCAHAHGASIEGNIAGSIGDAGCFSFYPTKVMTTGTGGIITTNNPDIANSAKELRLFGRKNGNGSVVREGNDWFLDEIRACVGLYQLEDLEVGLKRREIIAEMYQQAFEYTKGITLLKISENMRPSWYHYTVFVNHEMNYDQIVSDLMNTFQIPTKQIYLPLHKEFIFQEFDQSGLEKTENVLYRSLCLPLFVDMQDDQVNYVIDSVKKVLASF
jgi:perosamine synthetase